jgi:cobalt-zinc-cadmium efflux system outer membrane protein
VRRAQATSTDANLPPLLPPGLAPPGETARLAAAAPVVGGQSISLQAALYGALTGNPDLVALRQGTPTAPSPESVEVARHFPTALNPTLWVDLRPITLIPRDTFGSAVGGSTPGTGGATGTTPKPTSHPFYHNGNVYFYISLRQPIELGHQTTHRYNIARAALSQQQWTVVQAELVALVQTYRFFETAAYRREKLRIARQLAEFNDGLHKVLKQRMEANQALPADVSLALVESRAARQQVMAAEQDYVTALTDLRNQIGIPEQAGASEPLGEFSLPPTIPPVDEQAMIRTALQGRPDIMAARAQVDGAAAATRLARGDRIPSPIIGPEYQIDEVGVQYVGLVYITPVPILNSGKPLLRQRHAEYHRAIMSLHQIQQRAVAQVRAAVAKWNGATKLISESSGLTGELASEVTGMEKLFEAGQTDITRLMQARQRLIQLENAQLDATWAATQAQADLLLALGSQTLIGSMLNQTEAADRPSAPAQPAPPAATLPAR